MATELRGARVLIFVEDTVEDVELLYPKWRLQEASADVSVAGKEQRAYKGKKGYEITPDLTIAEAARERWDLVLVPGGYAPDKMRTNKDVLDIVRRQDEQRQPLAAICHAGWVLSSAGVARGRRLTSYPTIKDDLVNAGAQWVDEAVVVDGNLVTSRSPADLPVFGKALVDVVAQQRVAVPKQR